MGQARAQQPALLLLKPRREGGHRVGGQLHRVQVRRAVKRDRGGPHEVAHGEFAQIGHRRVGRVQQRVQRGLERTGALPAGTVAEHGEQVVVQGVGVQVEQRHRGRHPGPVGRRDPLAEQFGHAVAELADPVGQVGCLHDEGVRRVVRVEFRFEGQVGRDPDVPDQLADVGHQHVVCRVAARQVGFTGPQALPVLSQRGRQGGAVHLVRGRPQVRPQPAFGVEQGGELGVDARLALLQLRGGLLAGEHLAVQGPVPPEVDQQRAQRPQVVEPPQFVLGELDPPPVLDREEVARHRQRQHEGETDEGELVPDAWPQPHIARPPDRRRRLHCLPLALVDGTHTGP